MKLELFFLLNNTDLLCKHYLTGTVLGAGITKVKLCTTTAIIMCRVLWVNDSCISSIYGSYIILLRYCFSTCGMKYIKGTSKSSGDICQGMCIYSSHLQCSFSQYSNIFSRRKKCAFK